MKPYVREAALQVVAVVLKRRWLQATPAVKQTVFGQVEALLGGKGAAAGTTPEQGRMMGVCLLRSLLTEFSQEQARVTAMGMALEFHTKCSASFQVPVSLSVGCLHHDDAGSHVASPRSKH